MTRAQLIARLGQVSRKPRVRAEKHNVPLAHKQPGEARQNVYIEGGNRLAHGERMGHTPFETIRQAQEQKPEWLWTNNKRPPNGYRQHSRSVFRTNDPERRIEYQPADMHVKKKFLIQIVTQNKPWLPSVILLLKTVLTKVQNANECKFEPKIIRFLGVLNLCFCRLRFHNQCAD
ncbi:hypothetical protein [Roseobacter fucihabitans]|uniref:hypothetical protein n=1 Tax=Roseobacter fucihabitans TaxID=1537242 RepID=UPI001652E794|nr:hypothetical protein [Roseobacter litoralis]